MFGLPAALSHMIKQPDLNVVMYVTAEQHSPHKLTEWNLLKSFKDAFNKKLKHCPNEILQGKA